MFSNYLTINYMKLRLFPFIKQIPSIALVIFMAGCTQDETPDYNYFKVNGKEYKIEDCVISKCFENDTSGRIDIRFCYDKVYIDIIDSNKNVYTVPIYENGVFFRDCIFSGNVAGFYKVIRPNSYGYTIREKDCFYNSDTRLGKQYPPMVIESGELSIKMEGEKYIIDFKCTGESDINKKIIGHFSGTPVEYKLKCRD